MNKNILPKEYLSERLNIRLTPAQLDQLSYEAKKRNLDISTYMRKIVMGELKR